MIKAEEAQGLALEAHKKEFEWALKNISYAASTGKYHYEGPDWLSDYTIKELEKLGYKAKNFVDSNLNFYGSYLPENPYSYNMHIIEWDKKIINMTGINGKKRFSIYILGIGELNYGTCNESDDDRRDIVCENGEYYLVHYPKEGYDKPEIGRFHLDPMTLVANGYYEHERDSFVPVKDFVWK